MAITKMLSMYQMETLDFWFYMSMLYVMLCYALMCCDSDMLCYPNAILQYILCNAIYYTILYYTILYYTILYYTILYYTIIIWLANFVSSDWSIPGPITYGTDPDGTVTFAFFRFCFSCTLFKMAKLITLVLTKEALGLK